MKQIESWRESFYDLKILVGKELKIEVRDWKLLFSFLAMIVTGTANLAIIAISMRKKGIPGVETLLVDTLLAHLSLSMNLIMFFVLSGRSYMKERYTQSLEAMLATPVTPRVIWFSKTIFVLLNGIAVTTIVTLASVATISLISGSHLIIFPSGRALVFLFLVGPLLSFGLISLLGYLQLVSVRTVYYNTFIMFGVIGYLGVVSIRLNVFSVSGDMLVGYAAVGIVTSTLAYLLSRKLTREKMIIQ